jgi:CheY-like chemotaxis protein
MSTPSKHQVLVDDHPSVRETVALLLMSAGYDVAAAEDGFGAFLQLRKMLPDLIISDLNMPHMSGFELLSVVRRRFPEILTVAMSGAYRNSDELPPEVIADAFYAKGEHSTSLFGTLAQLLRTAPARRGDHHRQLAPAWIGRNGNDSQGIPYVVVGARSVYEPFR